MSGIDFTREAALARAKLLGWAFAAKSINPGLELGRDIRLTSGPNGIDFDRVSGMDALTQGLGIALTTRLGDDVFNVRFGFDGLNALTTEMNHVLARERVRVGVVQVLQREPRVRQIQDVKLADGQLELVADGTFVPGSDTSDDARSRQRRELNIAVAFRAISGEEASVNFGTVGVNG